MDNTTIVPILLSQSDLVIAKDIRENYVEYAKHEIMLRLSAERDGYEFDIKVVRNDRLTGNLESCTWAEIVQYEDGNEVESCNALDTEDVLAFVFDGASLKFRSGKQLFVFRAARLPVGL